MRTVFTEGEGLITQVAVGAEEGLKHPGWIMCDNLVSLSKAALTDYLGALGPNKLSALQSALREALDLRDGSVERN